MLYLQNNSPERQAPNDSWIAEMCLWSTWTHVGDLMMEAGGKRSSLASLGNIGAFGNPLRFFDRLPGELLKLEPSVETPSKARSLIANASDWLRWLPQTKMIILEGDVQQFPLKRLEDAWCSGCIQGLFPKEARRFGAGLYNPSVAPGPEGPTEGTWLAVFRASNWHYCPESGWDGNWSHVPHHKAQGQQYNRPIVALLRNWTLLEAAALEFPKDRFTARFQEVQAGEVLAERSIEGPEDLRLHRSSEGTYWVSFSFRSAFLAKLHVSFCHGIPKCKMVASIDASSMTEFTPEALWKKKHRQQQAFKNLNIANLKEDTALVEFSLNPRILLQVDLPSGLWIQVSSSETSSLPVTWAKRRVHLGIAHIKGPSGRHRPMPLKVGAKLGEFPHKGFGVKELREVRCSGKEPKRMIFSLQVGQPHINALETMHGAFTRLGRSAWIFPAEDFRALDYLLRRAEQNTHLCGLQVKELDLEQFASQMRSSSVIKTFLASASLEIHALTAMPRLEDLHKARIHADWPALLDVPEKEESPPEMVEVVPLPSVVVAGEVQLDLYPRGIQKEFLTLPREIVEAKIRVPLPEGAEVDPEMEGRAMLEELLESIRDMLASEDELRKIGGMEIQDKKQGMKRKDDGAYRHVTLPVALYLSASTSSQDIIEAFFREADDEEERGAKTEAAFHRSKSFSKRRVVKTLWKSLRDRNARPDLNSHCLHDVRGRVLRRITAELFWTQPTNYRESMDATCIVMSADGLMEVVNARGIHGAFYGVDQGSYRLQSKGVDALFGAVSHLGTERTEPTGNDLQAALDGKLMCKQMMQVRLDLLPERVTDIFFALAATNSRELGRFTQLGFRVVDSDIGATLAVQEEHRSQLTFEAVVIMCAIYKLGDGYWRIGSMNVTCSGSPRDLKAALSKLEQLGFPRKHETSSQDGEHLVVESVRRYLELSRSAVKVANVDIDGSNTMAIQYAIEVLAKDDADAHPKGEELQQKLSDGLQDAILEEIFKFTNEKVKPDRLRVLPPISKSLNHLFVEVRWEFGEVKRTDNKDHSYLDAALITFAKQSLQEIVDYRGPHGVRIVHNGVVDYNGMWIGPVGTSDAADGAIKYGGAEQMVKCPQNIPTLESIRSLA
eukprot:g28825.t1